MIDFINIQRANILIVDDQKTNICVLEQMLHGAGYVFISSTTEGRQVAELHRQNHYDLILLDLHMPGMDGFAVMEALQQIETEDYLPVLVITAQPEHKLRALKAGAKDFVSKPIQLAEVLLRVRNMLEVRLLHGKIKGLYVQLLREHTLLQQEVSERRRVEAALSQAQIQLSAHATLLEGLVAARTAELTVVNQRLEAALKTMGRASVKRRALLLESKIMQKKLQQRTRQIMTVQEEERKHISRELHDDVVQTLVGISFELASIFKAAAEGLKAKILYTLSLVENSVNQVHRFARALRPAVLDDLGLHAALQAYSHSLAERSKIAIHLTTFAGVEALGEKERTVLFRVAQEALTNVVRHARATLVKISVSEIAGAICMEVTDNGKSFSVEKITLSKNPKRLGLLGMKERIEMVGGRLSLKSACGQGTTVRVEVPFTLAPVLVVPAMA